MGKSLYNINDEHLHILQQIEALDGEITPELEQQLIINENELQVKSISYLEVIRQNDAFNDMIDQEIKRLTGLKKRNENINDRLKSNLLNAVRVFGAFETKFNKFGIRKSSSVEVDNVNSLPKEYKVITVSERADKVKLKEALNNGKNIDGVRIVENQNLKIN